jgi:peptide/nickel transport system substrate-binding protein
MTERAVEAALWTKTLREHRFDASAVGLTSDLVQDPYESLHSSSASGGLNYGSFRNAESDHLIEQARSEFDNEKRKEIYWRWQELIHEEQPVTFLFYPVEPAAYSNRFQNAQWLPLRPGYDLTTWWVPKDRQKYKNGTAQ